MVPPLAKPKCNPFNHAHAKDCAKKTPEPPAIGFAHAARHHARAAHGAPLAARADDVAKADQLFHEGLALKDKNVTQACAKFEESLASTRRRSARCSTSRCVTKSAGASPRRSEVSRGTRPRTRAGSPRAPGGSRGEARDARAGAALRDDQAHRAADGRHPDLDRRQGRAARPLDPPPGRSGQARDRGDGAWPRRVQDDDRAAPRQLEEVVVPRLAPSVANTRRTIGKIVTASGGLAGDRITLGLARGRSRYNARFPTAAMPMATATPMRTSDRVGANARNVGTVVGDRRARRDRRRDLPVDPVVGRPSGSAAGKVSVPGLGPGGGRDPRDRALLNAFFGMIGTMRESGLWIVARRLVGTAGAHSLRLAQRAAPQQTPQQKQAEQLFTDGRDLVQARELQGRVRQVRAGDRARSVRAGRDAEPRPVQREARQAEDVAQVVSRRADRREQREARRLRGGREGAHRRALLVVPDVKI